ncbi:hypothetical protein H5410_030816 [Solanum commersonii]|uniref:Uncharacterized protein n=1 Tax=Solanum commersonii TaxID=4109 RepID=A0A9J5YKG7_SOLCO|nr:hypothetical protein H5410_030816 [Solanum commersonii]
MSAHNKTQFTYAKIKCALKDSSCDSSISKNLMLTILALNASSSSTIVLKCPHTKNDTIFTHKGFWPKLAIQSTTNQEDCRLWIKRGLVFIKFLPKKGKAQGVFKSG